MPLLNSTPIVDLFAGPGGLGEGFASFNNGRTFQIIISAEKDPAAHQTLKLRAFFRNLKKKGGVGLFDYYKFCNGESNFPYSSLTKKSWNEAGLEAQLLTLGSEHDDIKLTEVIEKHGLNADIPWVLIGGPPCQAYSLVGRARNRGKLDYSAAKDHRHYLYREYLKVIQKHRPAVFVMENVKGILSSSVNGEKIFKTILQDLSDPDEAILGVSGSGYRIYSLAMPTVFERGMNPEEINAHDYIVRAEQYGIPQARHRVILLGVREDINITPDLLKKTTEVTVSHVITDLPKIRSRLSKESDSPEQWALLVKKHLQELLKEAKGNDELIGLADILYSYENLISDSLDSGSFIQFKNESSNLVKNSIDLWYEDNNLKVWLNHESRGHMSSDLRRYLYAATYSLAYGRSPKGHKEFVLEGLRPEHKNWESGKFSDRFRVQVASRPATTVTSHISKDGHYFIHPDPAQCRSLTVREAARLQTFPDNYFFQGNRTQQFHQVGNAVPPLLANKIAAVVSKMLAALRAEN